MLIAKSESLHGSLIYGPPLCSPPLPLSRCYYDFSFLSKIVHLFVNGFWPSVGSAAAVVWWRDRHLGSRSPPLIARLLNGGGAPASSPSSARRPCGVPGPWAQCTSCPRRGQRKLRAQPQAPPCRTGSPKTPHGLAGSCAGLMRRWWDPRSEILGWSRGDAGL